MRTLMLMLILAFCQPVLALDPAVSYAEAEEAYRQGEFKKAVEIYLAAIQAGEVSASLFYNLGTSLYKNGEMGAALAAHLRARSLSPGDPDIRYNVRFLQEKAQDKVDTRLATDRWHQITAAQWLSERALFWFAVIPLAIGLALVAWQFASGRSSLLAWAFGGLLLLAGLYPGLSLCHALWQEPDWGAIASPEVDVLASPTVRNAVVIFKLHEGAALAVIAESGDWFKIRLSDGKTGWVSREHLAIFGKKVFSYQTSKRDNSAEKSAL